MYKIVLQVPSKDAIEPELWQESSDPHGPHIKVRHDAVCPETGESVSQIRCKHRTLAELVSLFNKLLKDIEEY